MLIAGEDHCWNIKRELCLLRQDNLPLIDSNEVYCINNYYKPENYLLAEELAKVLHEKSPVEQKTYPFCYLF